MTIEVIAGIVVVIIITIVVLIQNAKESRVANNGSEKEQINKIVSEKISQTGNLTTVFAYWDEKQFRGTAHRLKIQTTSFNFAMSFNNDTVYLIPLSFGENTIIGDEVIELNADNLSLVNGKDGQRWIAFYDKSGEDIITLFVDSELRKSDNRYVNLNQNTEFEKFANWLPTFMDLVNTKNGTTPSHKIMKK